MIGDNYYKEYQIIGIWVGTTISVLIIFFKRRKSNKIQGEVSK